MDINPDDFIKDARLRGMSDNAIRSSLLNMGKDPDDIDTRLSAGTPLAINSDNSASSASPQPNPSAGGPKPQQTRLDSLGSLFGNTWRLFRGHFLTLSGIVLLPAVVFFAGVGLLALSKLPTILLGIVFIVVAILFGIAGGAALIVALHEKTTLIQSYRRGAHLSWPYFWVAILITLAIMGGYVMLVVPGIIMSVWFIFSTYIVIIEGKRGIGALTQSREYVRGHWWAIWGRSLLLSVIILIIFLPLSLLLTTIFGKTGGEIVMFVLETLIVVPFAAAFGYVMYTNLASLKPNLATSTATSGHAFFIVSSVVGLLSPFIMLVATFSIFGLALLSLFGATPPITILSPSGGENWQLNTSQYIRWSDPSASYIDIVLTCPSSVPLISCQPIGPNVPVLQLAEHIPNYGFLDWSVGSGYKSFNPGQYVIRVSDNANPSVSSVSQPFMITASTSTQVSLPAY